MYQCSECGQTTTFHNLCNDCVDKFMKELDEDLKKSDRPMWLYNSVILNSLRFLNHKMKQVKGER